VRAREATVDEIPAFWAGAQDHALGTMNLCSLAEAAGGFEALARGGAPLLVRLGVPELLASAWMRATPRITRGTAIRLDDPRYPDGLKRIEYPPPVLFVEGDPAALQGEERSVAIVGTRKCTSYGTTIAQTLGARLAAGGLTVVSGLARGIDAAAHRGALRAGRTVAVLGHGLAHTAPPSNRWLRRDIVENGGAIVSVWPDGLEPRPHLFLVRNQWVAALCKATIVVEAPSRSGAKHTAHRAVDLGRKVHVVPGPVGAEASRGCLELLRALPQSETDVVLDIEDTVAQLTSGVRREEDWLTGLFSGASLDDAARVSGRSIAELLAELSRLELQGKVVRLPGRRYAPGGNLA
jgi:DNA processing protein